jgi:hypothetical protein
VSGGYHPVPWRHGGGAAASLAVHRHGEEPPGPDGVRRGLAAGARHPAGRPRRPQRYGAGSSLHPSSSLRDTYSHTGLQGRRSYGHISLATFSGAGPLCGFALRFRGRCDTALGYREPSKLPGREGREVSLSSRFQEKCGIGWRSRVTSHSQSLQCAGSRNHSLYTPRSLSDGPEVEHGAHFLILYYPAFTV